ncbi:MAG TPA: Gfo/Idh/MocA family oxidoreductase [Micromonosporaceae bacterium]|jgi:predicted dehydrogenase
MTEPIRWGILATGRIAQDFTADLRLVPDAMAVAVASRTAESAQGFANEYDIPRAHGSWQALADDPDVDVVYVGTPHNAHFAAAKLMLEAGKAVLCEKPFTVTAAATRELLDIARTNRVFLAEAMWMRTNPGVRRVAELVESGAIGAIKSLHAEFCIRAPMDPKHRLRNPDLAGGAMLDLGVYPVTLAQLLLGTPTSIQATAKLTDLGVDETTGVLLGYDSGAHAALSCSIDSSGPVESTIIGETGHIEVPPQFHHPQRIVIRPYDGEPRTEEHAFEGNGLRFEAIEVGRCLREGLLESPLLPHAGTLAVMETMEEALRQVGVVYPAGA